MSTHRIQVLPFSLLKFYMCQWTSLCMAMYGDVRRLIWATFGGYWPLLATLPGDFALYFSCMVYNRHITVLPNVMAFVITSL
jgi:hypothetical protein